MDRLASPEWTWTSGAFVALLVLAGWTDLRARRIPNWLTLSGAGAAIGLRLWQGWTPAADGLLGVAVGIALSFPFFAAGFLGGGDAKLLAAVGGFMGPAALLRAALVIAVLGGVLAAAQAARRRLLGPLLWSSGHLLLSWLTLGRRGWPQPSGGERLAVPYGIAIAAGSLLCWFAPGWMP